MKQSTAIDRWNENIEKVLAYFAIEKSHSVNTQLLYRQVLEKFALWAASQQLTLQKIQSCHVEQFLREESKKGLAHSSIKIIIIALRHFFQFFKDRNEIKENPLYKKELPSIQSRLPQFLTKKEIEKILNLEFPNNPLGWRDKAILELLYSSGLRVSELISLKLEAYNPERSQIRVCGKGNKERAIPVGKCAKEALDKYILKGRNFFVKKKSEGEIFLSRLGKPLTRSRIRQLVIQYATQAGVDKRVYPHLFRHTFASHLLENGANLRIIQELLGHANIATTQIYTHVNLKHLKEIHHRCHPRANENI
ncbi:tyrosine recombinase [Methylacidiphilum kamchatkense]|uniref:Tyrosine recombinase XerC n=1 Tax=Methylacidiphilum kamchatkense Kam1 TaxID=1202785 RepID=A0A516TM80_9BACT|nr:tyrosine recombinase [Methylacidiphilum kamchatkense]QDQ42346.1 integrase/recombinase XerD [Methylacidiphilum kamchatkense Kam1]